MARKPATGSKANGYDVNSIQAFEGLEGVRKRGSMYIGEMDKRGVVHLFKEIAGNSIDEATNGFGKVIRCRFGKDGTITVADEGRGIPVGPFPKDKSRDTLTIIFTVLHSGGKFDSGKDNYSKGRIGCFVGSTKIKLLNGKSVRIDKLAERFKLTGKKRWVFAFNKESGLPFVPRKAYGVFATRMASELTEVVLDNGEVIRCTPDHPFMLWSGRYVHASKLKAGTSLRAVHFSYDKDGYLLHSGAKKFTEAKNHLGRVNRTVALAIGMDIEGKEVSHKNAIKHDNRPNNLQALDNRTHWWFDKENHGKNAHWSDKTEEDKRRSRKTMHRLNRQIEDIQEKAQLGRYAQTSARAFRDYGIVNERTYNASRGYNAPSYDAALLALGNERAILRLGKRYLRKYGTEGRYNNGGLGLNYALHSERPPISKEENDSIQQKAMVGKAIQTAARAYRDYGVLTEDTFTASRPWRGQSYNKAAERVGGERNLLRAAKSYLRQYGENGKRNSLNYKLMSEYDKSPALNCNNHKVVSVRTFKLKKPVQVYGMSVEEDHNYLLDAGVFVANTHGVGSAVVNALADRLEVYSYRNKVWNYQAFRRGIPIKSKPVTVKALPTDIGFSHPKKGTVVRFKPDLSCFIKNAKFDPSMARTWLDDISWLVGDVSFEIHDEFDKAYAKTGKPSIIHRPNGLHDRFNFELEKLGVEALYDPFIYHSDHIDIMLGWTTHTEEVVYSAVGAIRTVEHGTHVKGMEAAITDSFGCFAKKTDTYKPEYLRSGLVAVINVKMDEPKFNSQDKVKLVSEEAKQIVYDELYTNEVLWAWLKKNKELTSLVLNRAIEYTSLYSEFKATKKLAAAFKVEHRGGKIILPKKLKASTSDDPNERELYVVEGESAAGTGDDARNSINQEVLPLKGKIRNVWKVQEQETALLSEQVTNLMQSIGYNPDKPGTYRVGKVIILTDADQDGPLHPDTKILTLDGENPTIRQMAREWRKGRKPRLVYSQDKDGNLVIGTAFHPRKTVMSDVAYRIHMDDGTIIECTGDHGWALNNKNKKQFMYRGVPYVRTRDLRKGDSLTSLNIELRTSDGVRASLLSKNKYHCILNKEGYYVDRKVMPVHQFVKAFEDINRFNRYRNKNKGVNGGVIHIHHRDDDTINNEPENLQYLRMPKHGAKHVREYAKKWNGSKEHLESIRLFNSRPEQKKKFAKIRNRWNSSEGNKESTRKLNKREDIKLSQAIGKAAVILATLEASKIKVNRRNWNRVQMMLKRSSSSYDVYKKFSSEIRTRILDKGLTGKIVSLRDYKKAQYPTQCASKALAIATKAWNDFGEVTEKSYNAVRTARGVRGDPKWETALEHLQVTEKGLNRLGREKANNHTVVKVEVVNHKQPQPYYCMTVPEWGNFFVDDGTGSGILSKNSHITALVLGLLQRVVPDLVEQGRVFVVDAPLYLYRTDKGNLYAASLADLQRVYSKAYPRGTFLSQHVQRIKGWGETSSDVLRMVAFDKVSRKLLRVTPPKAKAELQKIVDLLGEDVQARRILLGL